MKIFATMSKGKLSIVQASIVLVMLAMLIDAQLRGTAQALSKGIHVEMVTTHSAVAMPSADEPDALIAVITEDGTVYLGTDQIDPSTLVAKRDVFSRAHEKFYIKADARASFSTVFEVLEKVRLAGVSTPVLLTNQLSTRAPGKVQPPRGLEVNLAPSPTNASPSTIVKILTSSQGDAVLKIGDQETSWTKLPRELSGHLGKATAKVLTVSADGSIKYAEVARAIDLCHAGGAKVFLRIGKT